MAPPRNTFAEGSDEYARSRPRYPAALFEWILGHCARRDAAWDCGCGSGQAAAALARSFRIVYATDVSPDQIRYAAATGNVVYSVASAEQSSLPAASCDLVTAAQALHWFDLGRFWPEVSRVARPGAFFCAWGYHDLGSTERIDRELIRPFESIVAPFWAEDNRRLWRGYRDEDVAFPYERVPAPPFAIEVAWTLEQLLAYFRTWSAFKKSRDDPAAAAAADRLFARARALPGPADVFPVRMPLTLVAGRI